VSDRPSSAEFRAGAARLDLLNNTATRRRAPPIIYLSSTSEQSDSDVEAVVAPELVFSAYVYTAITKICTC
jgi:hypothetical protein